MKWRVNRQHQSHMLMFELRSMVWSINGLLSHAVSVCLSVYYYS